MAAEILGRVAAVLVTILVAWALPLWLARGAAARAGRSPHWLWLGAYPFVGWFVWAVLRWQPAAIRCSACGKPLRAGARYCAACSAPAAAGGRPPSPSSAIDWLRGQAPCPTCRRPVKLAANACSFCGAPAPRVACPRCGSEATACGRDRRAILYGILLLIPAGAVSARYTNPRTGELMPPSTFGGVIEWAAALIPAVYAAVLLYRACTCRGYVVRCSSCGAASPAPPDPTMGPRPVGSEPGPAAAPTEPDPARSATRPAPAARAETAPQAAVLGEANQFLRYKAASRSKVDAQAALMDALLARPDAPGVKAVLLRSTDPNDDYPWLIVKSGSPAAIAEMRAYSGFEAAFAGLFGDQPFSIAWADHIAENCPAPGEAVTAHGREQYSRIAQAVREGRYALERRLGGGAASGGVGPGAAAAAPSAAAAHGHPTRCRQCGMDIGREWHYGFESIDLAAAVGAQCPQCGAITCAADLAYGPDGNYPACPRCGVAPETLSGGAAYSSMVEQAQAARRYRGAVKPPSVLGRPVQRG